jgi:hypothetical protein
MAKRKETEHNVKRSYYSYSIWVILTIALIAILIYFLTASGGSDTTIANYGANFTVTYEGNSLNSSQDIKNNYQTYISQATQFWNDILTEDTVIDIKVTTFSEASTSSGIVLAKAGPYSENNLKGGGNLYINIQANANSWVDVMKHEIGHIMGIGLNSYWNNSVLSGNLLDGSKFPISLQEYKYSYNGDPAATNIPLGPGDGHFSEDIFDRELMTPYSNAPYDQPATRLTLGALSDMGWSIDMTKSESAN